MSEIGVACVHAIVARAGYCFQLTRLDFDSIDATVTGKLHADHGIPPAEIRVRHLTLELQLKSFLMEEDEDDSFTYDLPINNYDDLREESTAPRLLVIMDMPKEMQDWLTTDSASLVAKRCPYYLCLHGMTGVRNTSARRVRIRRANRLTPEAIKALMQRIARGEIVDQAINNGI